MKYKVFVGLLWDGEPEYTHLLVRNLSWEEARDLLCERFMRWKGDVCPECEANAMEQAESLMNRTHEGEVWGSVEGDDYMILEDRDGYPNT